MTQPFSYHLYHKLTGKHYYGIKYSKGCSPIDLWTTYFSSSKLVKRLIEKFGADSFTVKVKRLFDSPEKALLWEHRLLSRINAAKRADWLNRHNGGPKFRGPTNQSENTKIVASKTHKGVPKTEEQKRKMSETAYKTNAKRKGSGWKMPLDSVIQRNETRQKRIDSGEINPYSAERNQKMSESKKGTKRKYLPDGSFVMIKSS
jgi:hypothetical protein